eukprot:232186_1
MFGFWKRSRSHKTIRDPQGKRHRRQSPSRILESSMKKTLKGGNIRDCVRLPEDTSLDEWLSENTIEMSNTASLIWECVFEFCNEKSCPKMSAGNKAEYYWSASKNKKPESLCAHSYIENLFDWIDGQISNSDIFPTEDDQKFPRDFKKQCGTILRRIFRLYAHVYHSHFTQIQELGFEAHLNTCFKHLTYFIVEFDLVPSRELLPLRQLLKKFLADREYKVLFDKHISNSNKD